MRGALGALVFLVLALPGIALAHGQDHALEQQLSANGEALLLGRFDAPQPGPLVVAPYRGGPLPCGEPAAAGFRLALGDGAGVAFLGNATHVAAVLDLPRPGFAAFAVDTHAAARTLLVMQEQAVALHRVVGAVPNGTAVEARAGVLGIPYALPGADAHGFGHAAADEVGLRLAWGGTTPACAAAAEHLTLAVARADLPESLRPGAVVHVVVLYDAALPQFLPRPLDSTAVLQANLYLARPGEDAAQVRAALASQPGVAEAVPLVALLGGAALLARRR